MTQDESPLIKIVVAASKGLADFEIRVDELFYGTPDRDGKKGRKGIYPTVLSINEVDPCNIINYYASKVNTSLIKDERTKEALSKIKTVASDINKAISDFTTYSPIDNKPRSFDTPPSQTVQAASGSLSTRQKLSNLFENIGMLKTEILAEIPPELFTLFPKLKTLSNPVQELQSLLTRYGSVNNIPNEDVQKIVQKVYKIQGIISAVASINSLQGIIGLSPDLQRQIQKLQKTLDPSKLLPTLKQISRSVKAINQFSLKVLKIISFARMILKVVYGLLTLVKTLQIFFQTNPLPSTFITEGIAETFNTAKLKAIEQIGNFRRFLKQMNALLGIVSDFITNLLGKLELLDRELQKLIIKIEACEPLKDLDLTQELKDSSSFLNQTIDKLKPYVAPKASKNSLRVGSILISVEEEELVDEGKKLKRRRAIAVDERGLLIAQGPLTFATDAKLLIEELRLQLVRDGLLTEKNTALSFDEQALLDDMEILVGDLEVTPTEELITQQADVQVELTSFIDGLKNARRLRKKVQAALARQTATLGQATNPSASTALAVSGGSTNSQSGARARLLSDTERARLQKYIQIYSTTPGKYSQVQSAKRKLAEDDAARKQLAAG